MPDIPMLIGNGLLILTFLLSLAYAITYHLVARWWETDFGRSLMSLKIALAVVTGLAAVRILFGVNADWYTALRLIVFVAVPLSLAWRLVVLIKIQRQSRKEDDQA
jgi:hypothetical protein